MVEIHFLFRHLSVDLEQYNKPHVRYEMLGNYVLQADYCNDVATADTRRRATGKLGKTWK